jgi:transposase
VARGKKGAQKEGRTLLFADEAGFYLLPTVVKTWAPEGRSPVLAEKLSRDHLSTIAAITPEGQLYTGIREEAFDGKSITGFLRHLLRKIEGSFTLFWDGASIHRAEEVKDLLSAGAAQRLRLQPLPGYAPEMNPTEGLWRYLKEVELKNRAYSDLSQLRRALETAMARLRRHPEILHSFFSHAGLL